MITYNHESFIKQAIESVLMQETDFPVELVIGEDCSTDSTRAIVTDYAKRYPNVIRALLPEQNLGAMANSVATVKACKGDYVAMLEGDDYWTRADKLQRQLDYLQSSPDCALCFHDSDIEECDSSGKTVQQRPFYSKIPPTRLDFDDFAGGFYPHTAACVFVNDRTGLQPVFDGRLSGSALSIFDCVLASGKLASYLDTKMSIYRVHAGGIYSMISTDRQLLMSNHGLLAAWRYFSKDKKGAIFAKRLIDNYIQIIRINWQQGRRAASVSYYLQVCRLILVSQSLGIFVYFSTRHLYCMKRSIRLLIQKL